MEKLLIRGKWNAKPDGIPRMAQSLSWLEDALIRRNWTSARLARNLSVPAQSTGIARFSVVAELGSGPDNPVGFNALAWLLATCKNKKYLDGGRAVTLATTACQLSSMKSGVYLDTLAAAYAQNGDFLHATVAEFLASMDPSWIR